MAASIGAPARRSKSERRTTGAGSSGGSSGWEFAHSGARIRGTKRRLFVPVAGSSNRATLAQTDFASRDASRTVSAPDALFGRRGDEILTARHRLFRHKSKSKTPLRGTGTRSRGRNSARLELEPLAGLFRLGLKQRFKKARVVKPLAGARKALADDRLPRFGEVGDERGDLPRLDLRDRNQLPAAGAAADAAGDRFALRFGLPDPGVDDHIGDGVEEREQFAHRGAAVGDRDIDLDGLSADRQRDVSRSGFRARACCPFGLDRVGKRSGVAATPFDPSGTQVSTEIGSLASSASRPPHSGALSRRNEPNRAKKAARREALVCDRRLVCRLARYGDRRVGLARRDPDSTCSAGWPRRRSGSRTARPCSRYPKPIQAFRGRSSPRGDLPVHPGRSLVSARRGSRDLDLKRFLVGFTAIYTISIACWLLGHYAYIAQTPDNALRLGITWSRSG